MDGFLTAAGLLPPGLRPAALALSPGERLRCEELRLRGGRPLSVNIGGLERPLSTPAVGAEELAAVLENASRASLHAVGAQLRRGYLSAGGGVRVGVCGSAVTESGEVLGLRSFSSLSIRIPRAVPGCADGLLPQLLEGGFRSTLLYAPPGGGKTTLLRELIRKLSEAGLRVSVADEREELAGAGDGRCGFDLGPCTDVLSGVPRAEAALMLLRAMNPQALALDEITDGADAGALLAATGCGAALLATVHARSLAELQSRSALRPLLEAGAFCRFVRIECRDGVRRYEVEAA